MSPAPVMEYSMQKQARQVHKFFFNSVSSSFVGIAGEQLRNTSARCNWNLR